MTAPCPCLGDDAHLALAARRVAERSIFAASHFVVLIECCPACGQHWIAVFMELIDWEGGHDSQASVLIPVSVVEAAGLPDFGSDAEAERALLAMDLTRRKLWWVHPRGREQPDEYWDAGALRLLPHD